MRELPQGWVHGTIPDLIGLDGVFVDGDWVESKDQDPDGDVRLIQLADIGDGNFLDKSRRFLTREKAKELRCTFLARGDILVARMPDPLGRACQFPGDVKEAVTVVDVCVVRGSSDHFDHRWLMHFVNAAPFRADIHSVQSGSTRKRISRGNLSKLSIPIPPRPEQTGIVSKLEELLSDLDAGVSELKAAQKKLQQYRQSLLKAAVDGSLTTGWREAQQEQGTPVETGAELLERILAERRARWECRQLAKFKEQGKAAPKDWRQKYLRPEIPDTSGLPALPEGWVWATVDQLGDIQGGIQKHPLRAPVKNKVPFLRVANVARGELRLQDIHEIELFPGELERLRLENGDVLIVEGNGSLTEIGRCAVWDGSVANAVHQNHLIRVRPLLLTGHWIEAWLNSPFGVSMLARLAATTSGLYTLSVSKIAKIPVPLPPLQEQGVAMHHLLEAEERRMEQLKATDSALTYSAAQRQNILRAAFAGRLVPQDPNDEPAGVLLERIRAERSVRATASKTVARRRVSQVTP